MCLSYLRVIGLSNDEKQLLISAANGAYFGTNISRISIINAMMRLGLVSRHGYHPKYGTPRWALTACGIKAAILLLDLETMPLLADQIIQDYENDIE